MLKLEHINKSFSSKTVFDDTQFIANPNELTILIGPSGAGKTTLFNIILNIENCEYSFNNEDISSLDKKGKEKFILDNISYASQKPTFIADLKMKDQISLLKQIYSNDYDVSELINLFELEKLLDCYPNQLSGGEKSRFAFILTLLKPAQIYMFDEPTSALDDIQASHIVAVLNDLKNKGNIVIISTHDHRLIEQGDKVYRIEDKKLNLIRELNSNKQTDKDKISKEYKLKDLFSYWLKMKEHHKFYNTCMTLLVAFGIVVAMCGIEYGYFVKKQFNTRVNATESNLLIVSKPTFIKYEYINSFRSYPFEKNDYEKIESVEHLKHYYNFLDYDILPNYLSVPLDYKKPINLLNNSGRTNEITLTLNEVSKNIPFGIDENADGDLGRFMTYPNEINFNKIIYEEWNDEGIYITYDFYNEYVKPLIKNQNDKKDIRITIPLYIPQHNVNGVVKYGIDRLQANTTSGIYVYDAMKIKGVLSEGYISIIDTSFWIESKFSFSLSNNEMQKYLDKYKRNDTWDCTFIYDKKECVCGEENKNYVIKENYDLPIISTPWSPNTLLVEVDDYKNISSVKKDLEDLGFNAYSKYVDVNDYINTENTIRDIVLIVSCSLFSIILLIHMILKFNNKHEEKSFSLYFKEKGFNNKMIRELNQQRFAFNSFDMAKKVIIIYICVSIILYFCFAIVLPIGIKNVIIFIILILLIEFVIPMCLEHYYAREEA